MCGAGRERSQDSAFSEHQVFQRRIISDHRKQHFAATRFGYRTRDNCAIGAQPFGPLARAVIDGDAVPGTQQTLGDASSHSSETDYGSIHLDHPHCSNFNGRSTKF